MDDDLIHYGTPRRSGRYPWGSGKKYEQRNRSFLGQVRALEKKGLSKSEIAKAMGLKPSQLPHKISIARMAARSADASFALRLKDKGYSNVEIGKRMGINESSVRSLLDPALQERAKHIRSLAETLKDHVDDKRYLDIGVGTEASLSVNRTQLDTAISMLEDEGYKVQYVKTLQLGTGKYTSVKVLTPPDVDGKELYRNRGNIKPVVLNPIENGKNPLGLEPVNRVSADRVYVRYKEDGGSDKDGLIELRRGVEDINLGQARYAQVRIGMEGDLYMKGMAVYSDDIPDGYDIIYNVNKERGTPAEKIFKPMQKDPKDPTKVDQDNPFGSSIQQRKYHDIDGNEKLSALNIVNEEGDWVSWSKNLSSQVLSKQRVELAQKQLDLAYKIKKDEFDELQSLTNPEVKKRLLQSFADDADASAVHLKAAALPRQASHVILPFTGIKENEVYAPGFKDGEVVVLIRHPHGGTFEIPELVVNNRNPEPRRIIGRARDAIGINPKVAAKLSGADFDGDTVIVIPNKNRDILTQPSLKALQEFDPRTAYKGYEGMPKMKLKTKETEMGNISNLITDMTIKGATVDEISRAVKHSMVVIDAEKHNLNYKQSYLDNNIAELKAIYQGSARKGAATLISRAKSEVRVDHRKDRYLVDPLTGKKIPIESGETYEVTDSKGNTKTVKRLSKSTLMEETDDAFTLSSGTRMENTYAEYANNLKRLANQARLEILRTPNSPTLPASKATFAEEVSSLKSKLNDAFKNKPLERNAQLVANAVVKSKKDANPDMDPDLLKKIKGQALVAARARVGADKHQIIITDREWEAIQAGAVSSSTLQSILLNTDVDALKQRSMPRTYRVMSPGKVARGREMLRRGYTQSEVAEALGVSVGALKDIID